MTSHDSGEIWSLPWHVLQRNLAAGIGVQRAALGGDARAATRGQEQKPMSSLDFDLDTQMSRLERAWRQAYDSSTVARADYRLLAASPKISRNLLSLARERLDRAEALQARIMAKIERLEDSMLGQN